MILGVVCCFIARANFVTAEISLSFSDLMKPVYVFFLLFSARMRQVYFFLLCAPEAEIFSFLLRCLSRASCVTAVLFLSFSNRLRPIYLFSSSHRHRPFFSYLDFPTLTHTHSLSRSLSIFSHACFNKISLHALRVKPAQKHTPQSSVSHSVAVLPFYTTPTHLIHF